MVHPGVGAVASSLDARDGVRAESGTLAAARCDVNGRGQRAAWVGFCVTLFKALPQVSGNIWTYNWDLGTTRPDAVGEERPVKSSCSIMA